MAEGTRFGFGIDTAPALALGIAIAGMGIGKGLKRFRMADRTVTVKGVAKKDVESDFAVWALGFRRGGVDFGAVQRALAEDRDRVVESLNKQGFAEAEIEVRPLQVQDLWTR